MPEAPGVGLTNMAIQSDSWRAKTSKFCTESKKMYRTALSIKNLAVQLTKVTPNVFNHIPRVAPLKLAEASIHSWVTFSTFKPHLFSPGNLKICRSTFLVALGAINRTNSIKIVMAQCIPYPVKNITLKPISAVALNPPGINASVPIIIMSRGTTKT